MKALLPFALLALVSACVAQSTMQVSNSPVSHGSTKRSASGGSSGTASHSANTAAGTASSGGTSFAGNTSSGTLGSSSGSSGSSSSSGNSNSSSSSGSGGGSGGNDGNCEDANLPPVLPDGGGCPNGSFVSQALDLLTCAPIAGATVQALNAVATPVSGSVVTAPDGVFLLCAPPGTAYTPYIAASSYSTVYYPGASRRGPTTPARTST